MIDEYGDRYGWTDEEVLEMTELAMFTNIIAGEIELEQFYKWVANKEREAAC